ncbi:MAG: hypothetical protein DMG65_14705 [Candidatus Angelobacter sp. Gp1-AA117]|nr:MAG: hypothetical protein DMG65_14705 [Candidatus Angelobacter sp. Gp1-AA117]
MYLIWHCFCSLKIFGTPKLDLEEVKQHENSSQEYKNFGYSNAEGAEDAEGTNSFYSRSANSLQSFSAFSAPSAVKIRKTHSCTRMRGSTA